MSILVDKNTRLVVQGITGREGTFHTNQMIDYGTNVVAGVTPGKGGQWFSTDDKKVPVFDTVKEAVEATDANTSLIFVPARFAVDAIYEAADAGIELIICLTEHIPVLDMIAARAYLDTLDARLIGPNCPGLLTPGQHGCPGRARQGITRAHSAASVQTAASASSSIASSISSASSSAASSSGSIRTGSGVPVAGSPRSSA